MQHTPSSWELLLASHVCRTVSPPSLHCPFCVALPFSHHPFHRPHLNSEDPALRQLHAGIPWPPFLPLLWGCLGLLCHMSQARFLCFLHERITACLCVSYPCCTRTTSRVTSVAQHLGSCWVTWIYKCAPLLFIWKLIHRKGGGS